MKYLAHPIIALLIQLAVFITFGSWGAGAAAASLAYIYRETTQAEYRWIETYGGGLRANMPWWGAFDPKAWNLKAMTDWIGPVVATTALALVMR